MGRPRTQHTSELTAAVVYLLRAGYRAKEIAFELGIKRPYVSKLRRWAEASRLIEPAPPVSGPAWTPEHEVRALRILDKSPAARIWKLLSIMHRRELLTKPLSIRVFPSVHYKEQNWEERLDHFGMMSAPYVRKLLCKSSSVGVSWGGTIDAITRGIEQSRRSSTPRRPVLMLPVCGEPLGYAVGTVRLNGPKFNVHLNVGTLPIKAGAINATRNATFNRELQQVVARHSWFYRVYRILHIGNLLGMFLVGASA
jgi:hypothetical protein